MARSVVRGAARDGDPERQFTLHVLDSAGVPAAEPVAGRYARDGDQLVFEALYPLATGLSYAAISGGDTVVVAGPAAPRLPPARVVRMEPEADTLPENALRFYVHFSRPMREGEAAAHLALLDGADTVRDAFLGFDTELWNPSRTRLTVLLDPGRIKRGLRPNRELGPPLVRGHQYRLVVDAGWRDENGAALAEGEALSFVAGAADRAALHVGAFSVVAPRGGTMDPVIVRSRVVLDAALSQRLSRVETADGHLASVTAEVVEKGRAIALRPREAWSAGAYRVVLGATLEDVAGNSFQRAFDRDLADGSNANDARAEVVMPFRIP